MSLSRKLSLAVLATVVALLTVQTAANNCLIPYCATCAMSILRCDACESGYKLSEASTGICVKSDPGAGCSVPNCKTCTSGAADCSECEDGYSLYEDGFVSCVETGSCRVPNCGTCGDSPYSCVSCADGSATNDQDFCSIKDSSCIGNCAVCNPALMNSCDECASGYHLNDSEDQCVDGDSAAPAASAFMAMSVIVAGTLSAMLMAA